MTRLAKMPIYLVLLLNIVLVFIETFHSLSSRVKFFAFIIHFYFIIYLLIRFIILRRRYLNALDAIVKRARELSSHGSIED